MKRWLLSRLRISLLAAMPVATVLVPAAVRADTSGSGQASANAIAINSTAVTTLVVSNGVGGNYVSSQQRGCWADKIGTWSEDQNQSPQRIVVGGGGFGHGDLYPNVGVPSVSFHWMPGPSTDYFGLGSVWEWPPFCASQPRGTACNNCVDYIADAEEYALGHMPQNNPEFKHSGLVVDLWLTTREIRVCSNLGGMAWSDVVALLRVHAAAMPKVSLTIVDDTATRCNDGPGGTPVTAVPAPVPVQVVTVAQPAPATAGPACNPATKLPDLVSKPGVPAHIESGSNWLLINGWSNWTNPNIPDFTFWMPPGESIDLKGGGSVWVRPNNCQQATMDEFNASPITRKFSLDQVRAMGFDNRTSPGTTPSMPVAASGDNVVAFVPRIVRREELATAA